MNREDRPLSTADLAGASEARGRSDEAVVGREAGVVDRPAGSAPTADNRPAADRQRDNAARPAATSSTGERPGPLFRDQDAGDFRRRWTEVQTGFVDEPRRAVEQADSLVADVMKRLAESFANERAALEKQWDRGDNVTTEDLRVAMQRYRSFFDRLLSI